ncbi:MAG: hypothetical protein HY718_05320, partial [Planctomycetes bacterium]|nr:hypothetical protein [Planctomycetota bacterium]
DNGIDLFYPSRFPPCTTGPSITCNVTGLLAARLLPADGNGLIAADFDSDFDVDAADFASFQRHVYDSSIAWIRRRWRDLAAV